MSDIPAHWEDVPAEKQHLDTVKNYGEVVSILYCDGVRVGYVTFLHISYNAHVGSQHAVGYAWKSQAQNACKRMFKKTIVNV